MDQDVNKPNEPTTTDTPGTTPADTTPPADYTPDPNIPAPTAAPAPDSQDDEIKPPSNNFTKILAIILVVALLGLGIAWYLRQHHAKATPLKTSATTTVAPTTTTTPSGTDNASLSKDLGDVNTGINQVGQDQTTATSGLNDQSSEVTVPTN